MVLNFNVTVDIYILMCHKSCTFSTYANLSGRIHIPFMAIGCIHVLEILYTFFYGVHGVCVRPCKVWSTNFNINIHVPIKPP